MSKGNMRYKINIVVLLWLSVFVKLKECKYGNNDIFTSLEAMKRLWIEERIFVKHIEDVIKNMKEMIPEMER